MARVKLCFATVQSAYLGCRDSDYVPNVTGPRRGCGVQLPSCSSLKLSQPCRLDGILISAFQQELFVTICGLLLKCNSLRRLKADGERNFCWPLYWIPIHRVDTLIQTYVSLLRCYALSRRLIRVCPTTARISAANGGPALHATEAKCSLPFRNSPTFTGTNLRDTICHTNTLEMIS
jgi:hypothetical protein